MSLKDIKCVPCKTGDKNLDDFRHYNTTHQTKAPEYIKGDRGISVVRTDYDIETQEMIISYSDGSKQRVLWPYGDKGPDGDTYIPVLSTFFDI